MVVLPKKTVAMWAQIRQSDTSLSSGWRDDTPQEIRALQHKSLCNVQASRFIFCHFFKGLAYSFEGPFRREYFHIEHSFIFLPIAVFEDNIQISSFWVCSLCPHYFLLVPEILWQETLVTTALYPFAAFLFQHLFEISLRALLQERNTPTFLV